MTPQEALQAFEDGKTSPDHELSIRVRTRSGAEYDVPKDLIEDAVHEEYGGGNDYVYGDRTNGRIHLRGRRRVDTREQIRWFHLKNVTLVVCETCGGEGVLAKQIGGPLGDIDVEDCPSCT